MYYFLSISLLTLGVTRCSGVDILFGRSADIRSVSWLRVVHILRYQNMEDSVPPSLKLHIYDNLSKEQYHMVNLSALQ